MARHWYDRLSLRFKATTVVLTVTTMAVVLMATASVLRMRRQIALEDQQTAQAMAQGLAHASELALAVRDEAELSRLAAGFLRDEQILFVAIYDARGKLVAKSVRSQRAWEAQLRGEVDEKTFILGQKSVEVSAAANQFGTDLTDDGAATRKSAALRPEANQEAVVGRAVVGLSTAPAQLAQQRQTVLTLATAAAAMGVSVVGVFIAVAAWTRRLNHLIDASQSISRGDFSQAISENRGDEIGRLAGAYEQMRQAVQQRDLDLRHFNETLQQQVQERTRSLEDALRAAEAADKAKSQFLANMSHEIRTPLNGVVGMLDLLRATTLDEHQQHYAQIARNSADALLNVINDILDFSKIEAGRMELEALDFDLPSVVEDLVEATGVTASRKGLELSCFIHPDVPDKVVGDPGRLRQILLNLVNNAIKFTHKGQVVVRAEVADQTAGEVVVKFSVTDSGIGIPKDRIGRLFQSFSQVDASTTRKFGGTGLGLAISKLLSAMMGGAIGLESEEGRGSTFWFTARFAKSIQCKPSRAPGGIAADMCRLPVLAVDDNPVNREIVQQQLAAWNMNVQTASDGPSALVELCQAARRGQPYKVAILDWHMPTMDGIDLARAIRAIRELDSLALIMLTSIEDRLKARELRELGFAAYLVKPVRQSRLYDTIAEVMSVAHDGAKEPRPMTIETAQPSTPATRNAHILLAEDNEINQMVAREILVQAGCTCDIVDNGRRALDAAFAKPYDLVLMDCQMPECDGFEATQLIRQREKEMAGGGPAQHIHIIALTANAIKGDREMCLAAGMDDYVSKPINPSELLKAIDSALAQRQSAPAASATEGAVPAPAGETQPSQFAPAHNAPAQTLPAQAAPTPVAPAEAVPVDVPSLLARCMGNAKLAGSVLERFPSQLAKDLDKLRQSISERNKENLVRQAHTLKGTAANVSAEPVRALAMELERIGRQGELDLAEQKLEQLKAEIDRCVAYLPVAKQTCAQPPTRAVALPFSNGM